MEIEITRLSRRRLSPHREHRAATASPFVATILLMAALFLAAFAAQPQTARAQTFPDVLPSNTAYSAIEALASRGVISGAKDGLFRPHDPLARAQAAKILVGWQGLTPARAPGITFTDLDTTYRTYVETAASNGWVRGYSTGAFRPYASLTREQMAIIMVRCVGKEADAQRLTAVQVRTLLGVFKDSDAISPSAAPYVAFAVDWGLFSGDDRGRLSPLNPITRAQFCMVLQRTDARITLTANRDALAAFMDTHLFGPRNSPITGEMVIQNTEWYGIPPVVQLVILAAETSLGDPRYGGELARHNNFGCLRYGRTDSPWGELSDGSISVAGYDWYSFPDAQIGMMAFGRYLKAGVSGFYLEPLTADPPDWRRFASVYYGQNTSGFEQYITRLKDFEDRYRAMAAERGLTI
jgi:hypothetical protein